MGKLIIKIRLNFNRIFYVLRIIIVIIKYEKINNKNKK